MTNFLGLPPELRIIIYEMVLTVDDILPIAEPYLPTYKIAMTATSRQIRHESLPVFYGVNTFEICASCDVAATAKALSRLPPAALLNFGGILCCAITSDEYYVIGEFFINLKQRSVGSPSTSLVRESAWKAVNAIVKGMEVRKHDDPLAVDDIMKAILEIHEACRCTLP